MEAHIGKVAYRVKLPKEANADNAFHVFQLEREVGNQLISPILPKFA